MAGLERDLSKRWKTVERVRAALLRRGARRAGKEERLLSPGSSARTERWTSTRPSCGSSASARSATATSFSPPAPRSTYYIDARLTTMSAEGLHLIGRLGAGRHPRPRLGTRRGRRADHGRRPRGLRDGAREPAPRRPSSTPSACARRPRNTAPGGASKATSTQGTASWWWRTSSPPAGRAIQAIAAVEEAGGRVLGVLAVVDREQGGSAALTERGYGVAVLTTATELGLR